MLYCVEVSEVSNSTLRSLEDVYWDIGKKIQGLNRYTPNPSVIHSMDWLSVVSIIDEIRLELFGSILSLEPSSIYIYESRYNLYLSKVYFSKQKLI